MVVSDTLGIDAEDKRRIARFLVTNSEASLLGDERDPTTTVAHVHAHLVVCLSPGECVVTTAGGLAAAMGLDGDGRTVSKHLKALADRGHDCGVAIDYEARRPGLAGRWRVERLATDGGGEGFGTDERESFTPITSFDTSVFDRESHYTSTDECALIRQLRREDVHPNEIMAAAGIGPSAFCEHAYGRCTHDPVEAGPPAEHIHDHSPRTSVERCGAFRRVLLDGDSASVNALASDPDVVRESEALSSSRKAQSAFRTTPCPAVIKKHVKGECAHDAEVGVPALLYEHDGNPAMGWWRPRPGVSGRRECADEDVGLTEASFPPGFFECLHRDRDTADADEHEDRHERAAERPPTRLVEVGDACSECGVDFDGLVTWRYHWWCKCPANSASGRAAAPDTDAKRAAIEARSTGW